MSNNGKKFVHPFCAPELEKIIEEAPVTEIAPEVWQITGNMGFKFFIIPPSSNIYILRDGDLVFILDTGNHSLYKKKILRILNKYKKEGARTLVLMVSQGHWDHAMNNDVIEEAGYENTHFLLPEPEEKVQHQPLEWSRMFRLLEPFYSEWSALVQQAKGLEEFARRFQEYSDPRYEKAWTALKALPNEGYNVTDARRAFRLFMDQVVWPDFRSMTEKADILPLITRETRLIGDQEFNGWQIGRFFIIHDASHSPGHICLYDPENKLILCGDTTIEVNPTFIDANWDTCININRQFRRLALEGFVELASDAHRNSKGWAAALKTINVDPLHPTQLKDVMVGPEECAGFFGAFYDMFRITREEIIAAWKRLGEATGEEILAETYKSDQPPIKFRKGLPFPNMPGTLLAKTIIEYGYTKRMDGNHHLYKPAEKWKFTPGMQTFWEV